MAFRPEMAASTISSTISGDDDGLRSFSAVNPLSSKSNAPATPRGYIYDQASQSPNSFNNRGSTVGGRLSTTMSNRPQSSSDKANRSHVPSMQAQGFHKPMSSQRLQQQRSGRPPTAVVIPAIAADEGPGDAETVGSTSTILQGRHPSKPGHEHHSLMRGTNFTGSVPPERTTNGSYINNLGVSEDVGHAPERSAELNSRMQSTPERQNTGENDISRFSPDSQRRSTHSFRPAFNLRNNRDPRTHVATGNGIPQLDTTEPSSDASKPSAPDSEKPKLGKNYEYFEGNTIFWGGGRFQNARDRPVNVATGVILTMPAVLFFVYSAPWLWHNVSPAIPIVFAYCFYICISSFIHASLIDPGIYPRNIHPFPPADENSDPLDLGPPTNDWVMIRLATSDTAAIDFPIKYCKTCNIWRPPRCYHCRVCDNCVETLDHHCVWLNNCVGRRNYRYFFTFVSSATLLGLYLIGASLGHCLAYQAQQDITFRQAINACRTPFAMFIYGILATPYPASLWFYHLFLMGRGETTREYLTSHKFLKVDRHRPFAQGNIFKNWMAVLGRPRPPTYLHFKQKYEDGDQRFGSRKGRQQALLVEAARNGGMEMKRMQKAFEGPSGRVLKAEESR